MNYSKHYNLLMEKAKDRRIEGYCESHHIIPKCIGGDDSDNNLVRLTAEEHFVAHQLLVKIYPNERKLIFALHSMGRSGAKVFRSNKLYGWIRKKCSKELSENNPMKNKETSKKISDMMKRSGRSKGENNPMKRKSVSEKFSGANSPVRRPVMCLETGIKFPTRVEAAKWLKPIGFLKASAQMLTNALNDEKRIAYGFHWKYV